MYKLLFAVLMTFCASTTMYGMHRGGRNSWPVHGVPQDWCPTPAVTASMYALKGFLDSRPPRYQVKKYTTPYGGAIIVITTEHRDQFTVTINNHGVITYEQ